MTLGKSINLSGPGFFHLQSEGVGRDDARGTFRGATCALLRYRGFSALC